MNEENKKSCMICGAIDGVTYTVGTSTEMSEADRKRAGYWPPIKGERIYELNVGSLEGITIILTNVNLSHMAGQDKQICQNCSRTLYTALSLGIIDNYLMPPDMCFGIFEYSDYINRQPKEFKIEHKPTIRKVTE